MMEDLNEAADPTVVELMTLIESCSPTTLLKILDDERRKFTEDNEKKISLLVAALIDKGVYPAKTVPGNGNTVRAMVSGWGPYWHKWEEPLNCPHCKVDLRDLKTGPPFKREIGIYDRARDRTDHFVCPDCEGVIPRK